MEGNEIVKMLEEDPSLQPFSWDSIAPFKNDPEIRKVPCLSSSSLSPPSVPLLSFSNLPCYPSHFLLLKLPFLVILIFSFSNLPSYPSPSSPLSQFPNQTASRKKRVQLCNWVSKARTSALLGRQKEDYEGSCPLFSLSWRSPWMCPWFPFSFSFRFHFVSFSLFSISISVSVSVSISISYFVLGLLS